MGASIIGSGACGEDSSDDVRSVFTRWEGAVAYRDTGKFPFAPRRGSGERSFLASNGKKGACGDAALAWSSKDVSKGTILDGASSETNLSRFRHSSGVGARFSWVYL